MILVDTSVWIDHLRAGDDRLATLLEEDSACCHLFVIGELACGNLKNRTEILGLVAGLRPCRKADDGEVLELIHGRHLFGRGLGLVDVHLLASCLIEGARLWTRDKALEAAARDLGMAAEVA